MSMRRQEEGRTLAYIGPRPRQAGASLRISWAKSPPAGGGKHTDVPAPAGRGPGEAPCRRRSLVPCSSLRAPPSAEPYLLGLFAEIVFYRRQFLPGRSQRKRCFVHRERRHEDSQLSPGAHDVVICSSQKSRFSGWRRLWSWGSLLQAECWAQPGEVFFRLSLV